VLVFVFRSGLGQLNAARLGEYGRRGPANHQSGASKQQRFPDHPTNFSLIPLAK
jgi:hypothetical protein